MALQAISKNFLYKTMTYRTFVNKCNTHKNQQDNGIYECAM